jgi:hypothetical protein
MAALLIIPEIDINCSPIGLVGENPSPCPQRAFWTYNYIIEEASSLY